MTDPANITLKRTTSDDPDFRQLVRELDADLAVRNGESNDFYAQFNKLDSIRHAIVAYSGAEPVGCGAIKAFDARSMEVKRMFVPVAQRGKGIAKRVLAALESWAAELDYDCCVLETGQDTNPEAANLYGKNGYVRIPNYGQYIGVENSVCFEKRLHGITNSTH
jgi:putative acetyltransferase